VKKMLTLLASLLLSIGAVACGSSASSGNGGGTAGSASKAPFVIGTVSDVSGALASSIGGANKALEAWADYTNAQGGINGHKVDLVALDTDSSPATTLSDVKQLVEQDHIIALVDAQANFYPTFEPYLDSQGIPVIGSYPNNPPFQTDPAHLWFPQGTTVDAMYADMFKVGQKYGGGSKMAFLYCVESPVCPVGVAPAAKAAGVKITYSEGISATAPSYTAPCLAAKQSGATMINIADASAIILRAMSNCVSQSYHPLLLAVDGQVASPWAATSAASGARIFENDAPFSDTSNPAVQLMQTELNKYAPGLVGSPLYDENVVYAWAAGLLFTAAAKAGHLGNGATATDVVNALYDLSGTTLGGIAPPLQYTRGQAHTISCGFVLGVRSGGFFMPQGQSQVCAQQS
jgi:branched-chain amino acid transport system substrate-binding protein